MDQVENGDSNNLKNKIINKIKESNDKKIVKTKSRKKKFKKILNLKKEKKTKFPRSVKNDQLTFETFKSKMNLPIKLDN